MLYRTPALGAEERHALAEIEQIQAALRHYVAEPRRWVGSVRRVLAARAIQGSNSIEGFHVSVEDAIAAVQGEEPEEAALRDVQAVSGYRRAMTYVIQLAADPEFEFAPALIRSLHFMMTEHSLIDASPGLWRPGPIWVRNDTTGDVVYEAPKPEAVPGLIAELMGELNADVATPSIVRAAMAHLNLVMIHPFRDGNGRMSRCLQTLVLARGGLLAPELCSIEEYLGRNTEAYYSILAEVGRGAWLPDGDAMPWVRFCLSAHYIQALSVARRIHESEQIWLALDDVRRAQKLNERSMAALLDAATGLRVKNASYRAVLRNQWLEEVSSQVASRDLNAMVERELLVARGSKRGAFYVAGPQLTEIADRVRRDRQPLSDRGLFRADPDPDEPALPI